MSVSAEPEALDRKEAEASGFYKQPHLHFSWTTVISRGLGLLLTSTLASSQASSDLAAIVHLTESGTPPLGLP